MNKVNQSMYGSGFFVCTLNIETFQSTEQGKHGIHFTSRDKPQPRNKF